VAIPVYTKRLNFLVNQAGPVNAAVPVGKIWVVRCIDIVSYAAAEYSFSAAIQPQALSFWTALTSGTGAQWHQWTGRQMMIPGEELELVATGALHALATGYEFSSP
jgi:hypothetical protein